MSKYFDKTVRLQSGTRQERIREIRGERLQGIAEGTSSAPGLASSSAASFPGRNECPGTHFNLIEQEEGEDSFCQIYQRDRSKKKDGGEDRVARTERESDRKKKWQTLWCCRDQQIACRMAQASAEKFNVLGLLKSKEWPQCHRECSWQVRQSPLCQKEKEQSRLSRVPDHEGGESQGGREPHLGQKGGIIAGARRGKSGLHRERRQIPMRKAKASKKEPP